MIVCYYLGSLLKKSPWFIPDLFMSAIVLEGDKPTHDVDSLSV
jgi:hypothetical protein